jgi:SAM-dependent methyltransferase
VTRVVATDLALAMLAAARRHIDAAAATNVDYAVADAHALPFSDRAFDLVTCRIAPHHFADVARFVREAARVLAPPSNARPGALLVIQDHVLPEDREAGAFIDSFERLRDPSHNRALTDREWMQTLQSAGLSVVHVEHLLKRHSFVSWTARQDCPPNVIAELHALVDRAPAPVRAWMAPRDWGTRDASFANHHILIAGRKDL